MPELLCECRWGVTLEGHRFDLRTWGESLPATYETWVEDHDDEVVLRSARFDGAVDAQRVLDLANPLLDEVNGAISAAKDARPVSLGNGVFEFLCDGSSRQHTIIAVPTAAFRLQGHPATLTVTGTDGSVVEMTRPPETKAQQVLLASKGEPELRKTLAELGKANDWFGLYRAYEAILKGVGGQPHSLWKDGWVSREEADRFDETCRHKRHVNKAAPANPMSFVDGRRFIRILVMKWVDSI